MSLSPLAERIYQTLIRQLRFPNPLISYGDLVRALGPLPPPNTNLKANDQRLFEALGEISRACQNKNPPLPILPSIVVRRAEDGSLGAPGPGYFALVFPQVREETARLQMWRDEVRRVVAFSYPEDLDSEPTPRRREPRVEPRWLHHPTVIAAIIGLVGTLLTVIVSVIFANRGEPAQVRQTDGQLVKKVTQSDEPLPQSDRHVANTVPQRSDNPSQVHQADQGPM